MNDMAYWHWLVLGLLLIAGEVFVPSTLLLWPGLSAILVGAIAFFMPSLGWPVLLLIWAGLSIALVVGWLAYKKKCPSKDKPSNINRRGEQYVGRHFTLTRDIVNNVGELHVDDTRWRIVCSHDLPAGTKVIAKSVEGTSLRVEEFIS